MLGVKLNHYLERWLAAVGIERLKELKAMGALTIDLLFLFTTINKEI
ncbi:MAG: hypothetical protein NC489_15565 [Ruminococcus flavefaciens]|nr:hypothetical protein [Ruminococcus flavefaciens]